MSLTGAQIRAARETLGWSRGELSFRARLPLAVVEVVEEHGSTFMLLAEQMAAVRGVLTEAGVDFEAAKPRAQQHGGEP